MSASPDAYDSTPAHGSGVVWTRVYLPTGHYAHLMPGDGGAVACERDAMPCCFTRCCRACGRHALAPRYDELPDPRCACPHYRQHGRDEWHGTGSQAEYDKAAALPLCPRCFAVRERQSQDPRLGTGHRVSESYGGRAT